jgi:hypothetical protein
MSSTARLGLPMLTPGQAQKELYHNEALQTLDIVAACAVEEPPRAAPPTAPVQGAAYIVASAPTGAWTGHSLCLACYTAGGWRFVSPREGMLAFVRSTSTWAAFRGAAWELGILRGASLVLAGQQVVGSRAAAIAAPSGGSTIDVEARAVVTQILAMLRQHGLIET